MVQNTPSWTLLLDPRLVSQSNNFIYFSLGTIKIWQERDATLEFFLSFFHILNLDPNVNSWVIASKIAISTNRNARIWSFFGLGLSSANQSSVKLQINLSTYSPQLNLGSSSPKRCNIHPRGSNNKFPFKYSTFYGLFIPTGSH